MILRSTAVALLLFGLYGCASSTPPVPNLTEILTGIASWYGEEFAGKTTANGEIFDPMQMTAAHRTFPFGTILEVTNPATSRAVQVRINDRGPYVGNRVLDLSYAAAKEIGLVQPGSGTVAMKVVQIGKGEREPPAPYVVQIDEIKEKIPFGEAPGVAFPLPSQSSSSPPPADSPSADFSVQVVQERQGVPTRRQVGADGTTIEDVPIPGAQPVVMPARPQPAPAQPRTVITARKAAGGKFVVQVGAFSSEPNARALQQRLLRIGQEAFIEKEELFLVRLGPFATRDQAVKARTDLESNGMSAIVVTQ